MYFSLKLFLKQVLFAANFQRNVTGLEMADKRIFFWDILYCIFYLVWYKFPHEILVFIAMIGAGGKTRCRAGSACPMMDEFF